MATYSYKRFKDTAERLLKKYGGAVTYQRLSATYDPDTGVTDTSPAAVSVTMVLRTQVAEYLQDDTKIISRFQGVVSSQSISFTPAAGDQITTSSKTFVVGYVEEINPSAADSIVYILHLSDSAMGSVGGQLA